MFNRIFPKQIDNDYRGHWLAIWLFLVVVLSKLAMGANSIFNTRYVVTTADNIPLDSFNAGGAEAVVSLFALFGLSQLVLALQSLVVLIRYRAMIPFMYLLLLIEHGGRRVLVLVNPIDRAEALPIGLYINLAILAVLLIGFVLSLLNKPGSPRRALAESTR